jgi:hypothetical protein
MIAGFGEMVSPDMRIVSLAGVSTRRQVMDDTSVQVSPDPFESIESLAQTVAHLALQLTIAQIQMRALGTVLERENLVGSAAVFDATSRIARESAGRFLSENLGPALADMIDVSDLERQIVAFLSVEA